MVLAAFGLSRISGGNTAEIKADQNLLVDGARWISGPEDAKVTVVEFSDAQCPACKAAQPYAEDVKKMDGVRFVFRHFPLIQIHPNAWTGARAAEAARMMGKGDNYVSKLFERQTEWSSMSDPTEKLIAYAKEMGLDDKEFAKKYKSDETDKMVGDDSSLGNRLKLQGTPTFFVNGEQISANFLKSKVEELLKK